MGSLFTAGRVLFCFLRGRDCPARRHILLIAVIAGVGAVCAGAEALGYTVERGIVYAAPGGTKLRATLYLPDDGGDGLRPAVVLIHGGGWIFGSRADPSMWWHARHLAANGYVAMSIDYRKMPAHRFPDCLYDSKAAVRWIRLNAARYRIDPQRLAALGASAGGHLAAMLGATGPEDGLEGTENLGESSAVRAVISLYGAVDLTYYEQPKGYARLAGATASYMKKFVGETQQMSRDAFEAASPIAYADANTCPFLFVHGMEDHIVPWKLAAAFHARLSALGVPSRLVTVPGVGHAFDLFHSDARAGCFLEMLKFLGAHLQAP